MSERVSNRHEGDLGGQFLPFGDIDQVGVTIIVPPSAAELASVQHTAWMLVNLLARFEGVVRRVGVRCPAGVRLRGRVVPLAPRDLDLATALVDGGNAVGVVPVEAGAQLERTIVVGGGRGDETHDSEFFAIGGGWCGGIAMAPVSDARLDIDSPLPFGPYVAGCLAAGEVFKAARMRTGTYTAPDSAFYSLWNCAATELPIVGGPSDASVTVNATLAGIGAVGCAAIHAVWASPSVGGTMVLADNDRKGLKASNLNRYSLFGRTSIGCLKASAAAQVASDAGVRWDPRDVGVESFKTATPYVLSAVDRNSARAAIQFQYPARILSASTTDLRAEVLRCGRPGVGACLRCYNEPEKLPPDEELRSRLKQAKENEIAELAASVGITLADAKEWIATGRCGLAGERLLPLLRQGNGEGAFAVGFVSVMAGTMLAAELVKGHLGFDGPLSEDLQRATFQFFSPLARSNRASPYRRDPTCPMCDPSTVACRMWAERYEGAGSK